MISNVVPKVSVRVVSHYKTQVSKEYTNKRFKRLDTQLNEPTNQNSIKVPKFVTLTNKKTLL